MQQLINECTWDKETGRSLTKLDRELDDMLQTGDDLDYVDISLIMTETTRLNDAVTSNNFIPELDTNAISTFGAVKNKTIKVIGFSKAPVIDVDEKSTISGITLDSCMSKMEEEYSSMTNMLKTLVSQANTGNTNTHPTTTQEAGGTVVSPVRGV